jgi:hypothetical protein
MGLATYRSCTFAEKRAVLRTFWSGHGDASDKINQAAREYAPFALSLVAVISVEVVTIAVLRVVRANGWAWVGTAAVVLALWSLWWTGVCRRRINVVARETSASPLPGASAP